MSKNKLRGIILLGRPLWGTHSLTLMISSLRQEPITRSLQLSHIPVAAFSQTDLFEFISNSDPHRNLSYQLQLQARTNVDMSTSSCGSTWCRHVHLRPHCFILTEACWCRLELAYFAEKISKTRLVCKNAVVLAYYGSCRLLVMGCCSSTESKFLSCSNYPPYGEVVRARDKLVSRTRKPLPGSYIFFALSLHPFGK